MYSRDHIKNDFRNFLRISESLKIKKKSHLKDNTNSGYTIEINDSEGHSIIDRIKDRTDIKLNAMNDKLQKGVNLMLKKLSNDFFKKDINYVELTYKLSNFKAIFMIKPKTKYIRISSIFEMSYKTDNALIWDINEFCILHPEINVLNESEAHFYTINLEDDDCFYSVEINERTNSFDVYVSDPNDIIKFNLEL